MDMDRHGLEVLSRDECLRLLAGTRVGRVGLSIGALPVVLPVVFLLHDDHVVLRAGGGTRFAAALRNAVVAFEVDDIDPVNGSGWSVLVTGVANEITDPAQLADAKLLPLPAWSPGDGDRFVRIHTRIVSGRRLGASLLADLCPRMERQS